MSHTNGYSSTAAFLGTRPNISESHSEISARVPSCIARRHRAAVLGVEHPDVWATRQVLAELLQTLGRWARYGPDCLARPGLAQLRHS